MKPALMTTGSADLDVILGGGLRPGSLLVLAGGPGTGKTILAQQMCFANVEGQNRIIYYTTLSEPHSKLVEHLQPFTFFDRDTVEDKIQFVHLSGLLTEESEGLTGVADEIARKALSDSPSVIVVDSSKALHDFAPRSQMRAFIYDLASRVSHSKALLIFVGEYTPDEMQQQPEFAVADAIVQLALEPHGATDRRWLRVLKMRGAAHLPGKHSFEIDQRGVVVFPRLETTLPGRIPVVRDRIATGIPALDAMLHGGLPSGDSTFVEGPTGVGKTVLSLHFLAGGLADDETCLYVSFQETREELLYKAQTLGMDLRPALEAGSLRVHHVPPVEINLDEIGGMLRAELQAAPADRVVIDSLAELIFTGERQRLPAYAWALSGFVAAAGATLLVTHDTAASPADGTGDLGFLFDNVLRLRYADADGATRRSLRVEKVRRSDHDKREVRFDIADGGINVSEDELPLGREEATGR